MYNDKIIYNAKKGIRKPSDPPTNQLSTAEIGII